MRIVIQRVKNASVTADKRLVGSIKHGLLLLIGICEEDSQEDIEWLSNKVVNMRIFNDDQGKMNLSLKDVGGSILNISQFTLFASTKKGNRPSFIKSASPEYANNLYEKWCDKIESLNIPSEKGIFGADMKVELLNDGPVTIVIDSKNRE